MARRLEKLSDRVPKLKEMETRNFPVVKSNHLIQKTRFDLTLVEQKLILHVIQMIEPKDDDFKTYRFSIKDYCKICQISDRSGKNYSIIKSSLKKISDKSFWMEQEDGTEVLIVRRNENRCNHRRGRCFPAHRMHGRQRLILSLPALTISCHQFLLHARQLFLNC
ncbi:replication initiation protein [Streptomyces sp. NPDC013489]|uniref:replication initiation protein n=1 Tax=Streptomyces sp. NPDC013489 TaxID=3155606 RepID=UPI0033E9EEFD